MKYIIQLSFLLVVLATITVSCKKSDSSTPSKSKTEYLTLSAWKIQSVGLDLNKDGTVDQDATSYFKPCNLDDTFTFKADSTGIRDEGATKCHPADPQTEIFTWLFKNNETILSGTFSFIHGDGTIITLNGTNLVISYDDTFGTSTSYRVIATLKH